MSLMPNNQTVKPSKKFQAIMDVYESVNAAAEAWGIEYNSLRRFVEGEGSITIETAVKIIKATHLTFEQLFEEAA